MRDEPEEPELRSQEEKGEEEEEEGEEGGSKQSFDGVVCAYAGDFFIRNAQERLNEAPSPCSTAWMCWP